MGPFKVKQTEVTCHCKDSYECPNIPASQKDLLRGRFLEALLFP